MEQLSDGSEQLLIRDVELYDVFANAVKRCDPRLPKPELEISEGGMIVSVDSERLTTVAEHLIRNAQDATDEDGQITISIVAAGSVATVRIRDTGCGMTPEFIRERLFRPFDSTKGSQSMGIGAYQARDYVRTLGGQLEVTSYPGSGTTFMIRLPLKNK
jgi:signal transduction histidine kinase